MGRSGERLARARLERDGYEILDRNWRSGRYELDLIVRREGVVAFVEVKTRVAGPQCAVDALAPAQRRRIRRAAESWIHAHRGVGREFRFDLVTVDVPHGGPPRVEHIPDAFFGDD